MAEAGEKSASKIVNFMKAHIEKETLAKIDYVRTVNADSIEPIERIDERVLIAMAVYVGRTRLIDNFIIEK